MGDLFIAFMLGATCGIVILSYIRYRTEQLVGALHIDSESIPDEPPYFFLEIDNNAGDITKLDYVTLEVVNENYLSR